MLYDKKRYEKVDDKKVLHKVKKHWVVMSAALLMALGGGAAVTHTNAHAMQNNNNGNDNDQSEKEQTGTQTQKSGTAGSTLVSAHQTFGPQSPQKTQPTQPSASAGQPTQQKLAQAGAQNSSQGSSAGSQTSKSAPVKQITAQATGFHRHLLNNSAKNAKNYKQPVGSTMQKPRVSLTMQPSFGATRQQRSFGAIPPKHKMFGDANPDPNDDGEVTIQSYNAKTGQVIGRPTTDYGSDGTAFDKEPYLKIHPSGYHDPIILSDVTTYKEGEPQNFKVGWMPESSNYTKLQYVIAYNYPSTADHKITDGTPANQAIAPLNIPFDLTAYENTNLLNYYGQYVHTNGEVADGGTESDTGGTFTHTYDIGVANGKDPNFKKTVKINSDTMAPTISGSGQPNNPTPPTPNPTNVTGSDNIYYKKIDLSNNKVLSDGAQLYRPGVPGMGLADELNDFMKDPFEPWNYHGQHEISSSTGSNGNYFVTYGTYPNRMKITYIDSSTDDILKVLHPRADDENKFDASAYETSPNVPNGYSFNGKIYYSGNDKIKQDYQGDGKEVTLYVKPAKNKMASIKIRYIYPSHNKIMVIASNIVSGPSKAKFQLPNQLPKVVVDGGYYPVGHTFLPHTYGDNTVPRVDVVLKKKKSSNNTNNSNLVKMTINYKNGDQEVGSTTASGPVGNPFDPSNYESNVPAGYKYVGGSVEGPSTYINGQSVVIPVQPVSNNSNNSNNQKPNNIPKMTLHYKDIDNQSDVLDDSIYGPSDQKFDITPYTKSIPSGYKFKYVDTSSMPANSDYSNGANPTIMIQKVNPNSDLATMTINYNTSDGYNNDSQMLHTITVQDMKNANFDINQYEKLAPKGFHYTGVRKGTNVPSNFNNSDVIDLVVAPSNGQITVNYLDKNNGNSNVKTITTTGKNSDSFDASYYENNVPSGYVPAGAEDNDVPSSYINNQPQTLNVYVKKANQPATMIIQYQYANGNLDGSPITVNGIQGAQFDPSIYLNDVPGNNHATTNGQDIKQNYPTFDNKTVTINVAPNAEQNNIGTIAINYVDRGTNQQVGSLTVSDLAGKNFNVTPYTKDVPQGYSDGSVNGTVPTKFNNGNQNVTIDVNKVSSDVSMPVNYVDPNGQTIDRVTATGKSGSQFDPTNYETSVSNNNGYMPAGYKFVGNNDSLPTSYINGQSVNIEIAPTTQTPKIAKVTINYKDADSGNHVNTLTASGNTTSDFDFNSYKNLIPNGYTFAYTDGTVPTKYDNSTFTIMLHEVNNKPNIAHMTVDYINQQTNQSVGTLPVSDEAGQSFKASNYTSTVPQGYNYANQVDDPTNGKFVDGGVVKVYVNPVQTPKAVSDVSMPVNYVDQTTNQTVGRTVASGKAGSDFDPNSYEQDVNNNGYVPAGYKFVSAGQNNPSSYTKGQSVTIYVTPKNQAPKVDHMTINYVDPNGQTIDRVVASGDDGNQFDPTAYETSVSKPNGYMPAGYKFVGNNANLPTNYADGQSVNIEVAPTTQTPQLAKVTINYKDADSGNPVNTLTASGNTTSDFDFNSYKNLIPSGYKYAYTDGAVPTKYDNSTVTIMLHKVTSNNQTEPKIAHMTINYVDSSNNTVAQIPVSDEAGQSFKASDYTKTVPQGYTYANNIDDPTNGKFVDGDVVKVYVNQVEAPKTVSDVSMPVNYVDPNGQTVGRTVASGKAGSNFDPNSYEQSVNDNGYVPDGYKFANAGQNNPSNYTNGQSVTMYVTPTSTHNGASDVQMEIIYEDSSDNNRPLSRIYVTGKQGTKFSDTPYRNDVPQGCNFIKTDPNAPKTYQSDQDVIIYVNKQHANTMTFQYRDVSDGKVIDSVSVTGMPSDSFDPTPYTQNVPSDYTFDGDASALPTDFKKGGIYSLQVKKNAPSDGNVKVTYFDKNAKQSVGNTVTATGRNDTNFNVNEYESNVPQGYEYAGSTSANVPSDYSNKITPKVTIYVNKVVSSDVQIPVNYLNSSDHNKIMNTLVATGKKGDPFDASDVRNYENDVPQDYDFNGTEGNPPLTYQDGESFNIYVTKATQPQAASMTIDYLYNGNPVGTATVNGIAGNQFTKSDLQQYTNDVPQGYKYDNGNINAPRTYQNGAEFDIPVDLITSSDVQIPVKYMDVSDNQQVGNEITTTGKNSDPFVASDYTNDIPKGYQFVRVDGSTPQNYLLGKKQHFTVDVAKVNQPQAVSMTIDYMDGDKQVGTATVNGIAGKQFTNSDLKQYTNNVPQGYKYDNGRVTAPSTYQNTEFNIPVDKITDNTKKTPQSNIAHMTIVYQNNGSDVGTPIKLAENNNTSFDLAQFKTDLPIGYSYKSAMALVNGNPASIPSQYTDGTLITIQLTKNPQPVNASVQYVDQNGNKIGKPIEVNGIVGQPLSPSQYENNVPSDYSYHDDASLDQPLSAQVNGETIQVPVQANEITMPVTYVNKSDSDVVDETSTTGRFNSHFDVTPYENTVAKNGYMPQGYQFVGVDGKLPWTYTNGNSVMLYVSSNQPKAATMTIDYLDQSNHNKQIGNGLTINGHIGDSFDVSPYTQTLPAGYQFSDNGNNVLDNATKFTEPSHTIDIMVTPIPKNTQPAYATMPITYVDRKSRQTVGNTNAVGAVGTQFKPDQYEHNVPSGYRFTPNDSVSYSGNYANGQPVTIYVDLIDTTTNHNNNNNNSSSNNGNNANATTGNHNSGDNGNQNNGQNPTQSMGSITVNYADDKSGQTVSDDKFTVSDVVGKPFNDAPFVNNIPQGYSFDRVDESNKPEQYTSDPQTLTIYVSKKPVTVKPNPTNNSSTTNNSTTTNSSNTSNNGGSTNAAKRQTMGTITINYLDQANSNPIGDTVTVSDVAGHNFTIAPYEHNLPAGYHNGRLVGSAPTEFTDGNQNVYITVTQNRKAAKPARRASKAAHVEKDAKMTIQYAHNGQPVGTPSNATAVGQPGTELNMVPYEMDVPTGYRYNNGAIQEDGVTIDRPVTFEDGQTVTVEVEPIDTNADHRHTAAAAVNNNGSNNDEEANANSDAVSDEGNSLIQIPVSYYWYDPSGNLTRVGYATADGIDGQYFDRLNQFVDNVPDGFVNGRVMGNPPMKYANNEQLNILVSKKQPTNTTSPVKTNDQDQGANKNKSVNNGNNGNPQIVNMMITYMYNHNVVGTNDVLPGPEGASFDIGQYLMAPNVPEGYHYAGYISGNVDSYVRGHEIAVDVAPNDSGNDSRNSSNVNGNNNGNDADNNGNNNNHSSNNSANESQQNENSQPNNAKMVVSYVYNGNVVGSNSDINGVQGRPFNIDPYLTNVPTNYQADKVLNGTDHFEDGKNILVMVHPTNSNSNDNNSNNDAKPSNNNEQSNRQSNDDNQSNDNQSPTPKIATMPIDYMYNGRPVGNNSATGIAGNPFDVTPYEVSVPTGYQNTGSVANDTNKYEDGNHIYIEVEPIDSNNNGGNQQNFSGNGHSNNSGSRSAKGNASNGQPSNPTNTYSPNYEPNYDPTVIVYPNGQESSVNKNGSSTGSGSGSGSGGHPKTNRGANTDPNHEQNNNGSASDQKQNSANANQPNGKKDRGSQTANNGKATSGGNATNSKGGSSSNPSGGIVINNNPVINYNPSNTNEMNGNGGGQPNDSNATNRGTSNQPANRGGSANSTDDKHEDQPSGHGSTDSGSGAINNNNYNNNVNGGSSTPSRNSSNHSSQSTNGDNHSPNSQPNQNTPNDDSGSTGNHQSQSQSQTVNVNGGSTNGGGTNHASQPSNGSSTGSSTGQGSNAANGSNGGSTNNFNPSNTNSGNNQQSQSGSINGNGSDSSTNGNGSKANGTDQNDSTVDSIMSRQDSVIASLASQVATKGSNGSTNSTTNNYYSSTIASLSSEITSVENSINSKGTGQNGAGGNTGSQGSQASGNASGNNAGGNPSPSTASNGSTSTASNSELNSLNSTINSLEKRMNNQSSGPTTVNNYYGNGGSNNSSAPSNGYQPATNNFSPSFNPSVTNNVPTPNSGNSTTNSSNEAQPNGNNSSQQTPSTDTNQKVSRRRTQSTHRNTRSRDRNGGSKKRTGRVSRRHSRATTNRKASSDIEYRPVNGDQLFNYGDRNGFSNGNHVGQRNSRGTSLIINGRHDRFGDRFADTLHNKHASFAVDHDHTTGRNRRRLAQTGEANNTREFKMLGSILLAVGAGLSQMGASFKRRRRRRHFELDRRYNRYKN